MVKLIVFKFYINSEAGIVLCLFLIFGNFEPRCSYEIALIKKELAGDIYKLKQFLSQF